MQEKIEGNVFTGLGEGAKYISMDHYSNSIEDITGFEPFPGTLNLYVDPEERKRFLEEQNSTRVEPVDDYIGFNVYEASIEGIECAVLDLDVTDHGDDVIEVVAPVELREQLDLEDGDKVTLRY